MKICVFIVLVEPQGVIVRRRIVSIPAVHVHTGNSRGINGGINGGINAHVNYYVTTAC